MAARLRCSPNVSSDWSRSRATQTHTKDPQSEHASQEVGRPATTRGENVGETEGNENHAPKWESNLYTHLGRLLLDGQHGVSHPNSHPGVVRLQAVGTKGTRAHDSGSREEARKERAAWITLCQSALQSSRALATPHHTTHHPNTQPYRARHGQHRGRVLHAVHHAESLQVVHLDVAVQGARHEPRLAAIQAQGRDRLPARYHAQHNHQTTNHNMLRAAKSRAVQRSVTHHLCKLHSPRRTHT